MIPVHPDIGFEILEPKGFTFRKGETFRLHPQHLSATRVAFLKKRRAFLKASGLLPKRLRLFKSSSL